jgi:primosomal protein N' (replication factor Y)
MIARVVIDSPLPQLDRLFDYEIPSLLEGEVAVGIRVRVQFGRSKTLHEAFVVEITESSDYEGTLSVVVEVVSPAKVLDPNVYALVRAVADRQAATASDVLRLAIPDRSVAVEKKWLANGQTVNAIVMKGRGTRTTSIVAPVTTAVGPQWVNEVVSLAEQTRAAGQSVIIVVPDFRDQAALLSGFSNEQFQVVNLSTNTTKSKRYENFLQCISDDASIVVGSRSAIFAPVHNLGLIIVWDDGDPSHNEPTSPYSHTREVALIRQNLEDCNIKFLGHTRSTEIERLVSLKYLVDTTTDFPLPRVAHSDSDIRVDSMAWKCIREGLKIGPVLVQVAGKGVSSSAFCSDCDVRAECKTCNGPLWIDGRNHIRCRWCNAVNLDHQCSSCNSRKFKHGTAGSTRTVAEFGRAFPGTQIIEATGDMKVESYKQGQFLVIATPGAEPRVEGGYSAVVILDAKRSLNRDTLRASEDAVRQWSNAISLGSASCHSVLVGVTGELARRYSLWSQKEIANNELRTRQELKFPPAIRLASIGASKSLIAEIVEELSSVPNIQILGPVPISNQGIETEWRVLIKYEYSQGAQLAGELKALSLKLSAGQHRVSARSGRAMRPIRIKMDDVEVI